VQVRAPRLLLAAALLFWGWQTRMLIFALPAAALLIASAFVRKRFAFTQREFARLWDLSLLVIVGAVIYNRQTLSVSGAVIAFLQWLPILLFPFTAAVLFSHSDRVPHSTFLFWWRTKTARTERAMNPVYPYFAVCLLAASAGSARDFWFYPMGVVLIAGALAIDRPSQPSRPVLAVILFLAVAAAGYFLHTRWRDFQTELESKTIHWFTGFFPKQFEDQETHTSLGEIGKLKSSGRVVMRVRSETGTRPPTLFRQVSFDRYRRGIWLSTRRQYTPVPEVEAGTWVFGSGSNSSNSVVLCASVPGGRILLPMPIGCSRARGLAATYLERNRFGNVRVWDSQDPMECRLDFNSGLSQEPPPQKSDLEVHLGDEPVIAQIARDLHIDSSRPARTLEILEGFFTTGFRYMPVVSAPTASTPTESAFIATFLTNTHAGHCEYFATAAVLLLRKANIPARYAMGYAAVEPATNPREFRIRERHAHSWVLAWIDGRWHDFDPTPHTWNDTELRQSSMLRPLSDRWADLRFWFAAWQPLPGLNGRLAIYLLCPPGLVLVWALLRRRGKLRTQSQRPSLAHAYAWPGLDSEFFLIENALKKNGVTRQTDETTAAWLLRLTPQHSSLLQIEPALRLHYKYRFDPLGLTADERLLLAKNVRSWLAEHQDHS
jgi:protein-glutamine gamma-glutamyltransferase